MLDLRGLLVTLAVASMLWNKSKCETDTLTYLEDVMSVYPSGQRIDWPTDLDEENYTEHGRYVPINILPTRFQMYNDVAFILTPRYRMGVPSTLYTVQMRGCKMAARMEPWPCLKANNDEDPCAILNAVDLVLDEDGILWLLDIGEGNTLGPAPYNFYPPPKSQCCFKFVPVCQPPRILGINIFNGKLEHRIEMGTYICENSRLQYIQVEKPCKGNKFIYVTDAGTRSILMFEVAEGEGYRVLLPSCLEEGDLSKDILYIALVSEPGASSNLLFLTYLTSRRMFVVSTGKLWKKKEVGELLLVGPKPGPMVMLGVDNQRRIFFRMRGEGDIFMWRVDEEFRTCNFELVRSSDCRRGTHVASGYLGLVWLLESNFQDFVRGDQSFSKKIDSSSPISLLVSVLDAGTTGCVGPSAKVVPLINRSDYDEAKKSVLNHKNMTNPSR